MLDNTDYLVRRTDFAGMNRRLKSVTVCGALAGCLFLIPGAARLHGQVLLTGNGPGLTAKLFQSDLAIFEAGEERKDIPCTVTQSKPTLGFDLRFHAGYDVSIPMRELAGSENMLTILFRVTPKIGGGQTTYFQQKIRVPQIEEDAKNDAYLQGTYEIGEGDYKVDWMVRDRLERVCSSTWDVSAELQNKDKQLELAIPPKTVQMADPEQFKDEPPIERAADQHLKVKMLVNFAPQSQHAATLQPIDTSALVSILRSISRDPRIEKFSIVAFNLQERRVLYRSEDVNRIDFPAIGEAVSTVKPGTVDLSRLAEKKGDVAFLTELIAKEVKGSDSADAIVFAGPKALVDESVPADSLREIGDVSSPMFYMNYNLNPQTVPWTDAIGKTVKFYRGYEYTISRPRDLWFAVTEMVSRIVKLKHSRVVGTSSE